jgi:hypothetical protein
VKLKNPPSAMFMPAAYMRTIHRKNVATVIKSWAAPIFIGLVIVTMFAMTHQMCAQIARIPAGKDGAAVSSCSPGLGEREGGHNHSASESRPNRQQ